jgi:hypothetical protein
MEQAINSYGKMNAKLRPAALHVGTVTGERFKIGEP